MHLEKQFPRSEGLHEFGRNMYFVFKNRGTAVCMLWFWPPRTMCYFMRCLIKRQIYTKWIDLTKKISMALKYTQLQKITNLLWSQHHIVGSINCFTWQIGDCRRHYYPNGSRILECRGIKTTATNAQPRVIK